MPTLLVIEVSPRHAFSTSRRLTAHFIDAWKAAHPGSVVVVRDLIKTPPPFVDHARIGGAFTPREQHSPESAAAIKVSDELVAEIKAADEIVIGTPMFNFSIPAVLKAYIDQIVRVGVTVSPNNVGLLTGKKATVILAKRRRLQPGFARREIQPGQRLSSPSPGLDWDQGRRIHPCWARACRRRGRNGSRGVRRRRQVGRSRHASRCRVNAASSGTGRLRRSTLWKR